MVEKAVPVKLVGMKEKAATIDNKISNKDTLIFLIITY